MLDTDFRTEKFIPLYFTKLKILLVKLTKCVISLVTDMDDRLYQMLFCDENAEIQDCGDSSTHRREETENKMLFKRETRLLYRGNTSSKLCRGRTNTVLGFT